MAARPDPVEEWGRAMPVDDDHRRRTRAKPAPAPLVEIDPISLQGVPIPPRRWLVPGLIPWKSVTLLGGDGGLGKSIVMLQLQVAAALGEKWLNQPVTPVKSWGLYCEEDSDELHRRLADVGRHYGAELGDLENVRVVPRVGDDNIMAETRGADRIFATDFYHEVVDRASAFGAQLLVLDTAADCYGGNENFRTQVRTFVQLLRNVAIELNGAVVLTAHPSLAGLNTGSGISGSTGWHNSVRSRMYLTRPRNADETAEPLAAERVLRPMKSNYGPPADDIFLTWRDGVFIAEETPSGMLRAIADRKAERVFLECLDIATEQGRALSEAPNATNYAPKVMARMPQAEGVKDPDLARAMERLFNASEIRIGTPIKGSDRHPRRGIVRAATEQNYTENSGE
jgi:RecA-family ATPase